jgi:hypothetical protein
MNAWTLVLAAFILLWQGVETGALPFAEHAKQLHAVLIVRAKMCLQPTTR